ncbi:MAG: glycosyltransferase [Oligoflexia bacterium]|nr:glycosyltransferase [Oligoflexia bacterium]
MQKQIGFVLKGYPRLSETFIAQEMQLLEERGFSLVIYSMRAARDKVLHPVHKKIKARVKYLPEDVFPLLEIPYKNFRTFLKFPIGYLSALKHAIYYSIVRKSDSPIKRLLQAGWLLDEEKIGKGDEISHLHSHFIHTPTEMTMYLKIISGVTYSISAHAKDIYTITEAEIRERVENAEFLMTCTHFNYEKIKSIVGGAHKFKVNEVYHGVNLHTFEPEPKVDKSDLPKRLITVARLVEKKGYDTVFEAIKILKDEGINLEYEIFGDGELRENLKELAANLGIAKGIRFHGAVSQNEVIKAYNFGGIFVLGSRLTSNGDRDGIPNSMAEAMSMQLPVVATNISGIPELLEHERTGLLVESNDASSMALAIKRLIEQPDFAYALGIAAREKVQKCFDANMCISSCEKLLAPYRGN